MKNQGTIIIIVIVFLLLVGGCCCMMCKPKENFKISITDVNEEELSRFLKSREPEPVKEAELKIESNLDAPTPLVDLQKPAPKVIPAPISIQAPRVNPTPTPISIQAPNEEPNEEELE